MGGYGFGRYGFLGETPKKTVESVLSLSISKVKGSLKPGQQQVAFKFLGRDFTLSLDWTACNYGSQRPWWRCPRCQKRVGKLYLPATRVFACRSCHNLTYRICQVEKLEAMNITHGRLRQRLGATGLDLARMADFPPKPKGMHWKTYEKILMKITANCHEFYEEMSERNTKLFMSMSKRFNLLPDSEEVEKMLKELSH